MGIVEDIRKEGISVKALHTTHSVCFENIYGENQNERTQRVTAKADPFTVEGLKDTDARIIHLGSLLADDFSLEVIKFLSGKGLLSVDVQGFLRKVENEKVLAVDWPEKEEALKYIHMLIYAQGEFHEIPAYPALQITDATGCGDTYMVGDLYMRNKGASHREAGCFAAAMCTIKLQSHGPFCGTEEAINNVIKG